MAEGDAGSSARAIARAPLLLVAGFMVLSVGQSIVVPVFSAPDEPFHFEYVRHLARFGSLPDQTTDAMRISSEGMGPPLYYGIAAVLLRILDPDLGDGLVVHTHGDIARFVARPGLGMPNRLQPPLNPRYLKWGFGDEPNMFLRMQGDRFPWSGPARVIHLLRLISVLCGVGTVWLVYRMATLVWPDRSELGLLAMALVAFDPQFVFVSASINNDAAVILLATASLFVATRLLIDESASPRDEWLLGGLIGLALLTKTNAAFLLPVALGVIAFRARDRRGGLRVLAAAGLRVGAPVVVIAGWFVVRGALLYGITDPLGFSLRAAQNPDLVLPVAQRGAFLADVFGARLFQSYWGLFDWITLPMPEGVYVFYGLISCLGLAGAIVRLFSEADRRERLCTGLYATAFLLVLGALGYLNLTFHSAQSRLLFPAISGVAILLAGGLDTAMASVLSGRGLSSAHVALRVSLALLAVFVIGGVLVPAYA